jgi:uncharacterized protein (TIGR03085 family)
MSTARERGLPLDMRERLELCDLLAELGPDAPTLCEGWTTLDLAAHLVLREHFARWTDERMSVEKAKGLPVLIDRLRGGAPVVPWRLPGIRTLLNGVEYFIHHEDVRRANGLDRRVDRPDLEALAWRMTGFIGRRVARQIRPHGLELRRSEGEPRQFGSAGGAVLSGEPTELLLYLAGRRDAAQVRLDGGADAVAALRDAHIGV